MNGVLIPEQIIECPNYVNGTWVKGSGPARDIYSPYSGTVVGRIWESTPQDVADAVEGAARAQETWAATPLKERSAVLFRFRDILLRDLPAIIQRICLENGKIPAEAKASLLKGIEVLEFATSIQNLDEGGKMEVSREVFCEYRRIPLGVVAGITPFNFPAMVPMWMFPIALALGNAFVWKPSDKTPLTSLLIVAALKEAGLPDGVMTVVHGAGPTVEAIIDHPQVKAIGFVGSTKIAKLIYQRGTGHHKRVLALGGAKNHLILLPDANPEMAANGISDSFTGCAGQRCMAASVLLAVGEVDPVIDRIRSRAASLALGRDMGAIITKEQVAFLNQAIERAEKAGAKVILDGRNQPPPEDYRGGFWLGPTILDRVPPDSEAATQELFGPVLSIVHCKNVSEALAVENANPYGNAASIFTTSGSMAEKVARGAKAAMVGINIGIPVPREPFSFGGINDSKFGYGDITGKNSLNFWSDIKKVTTKWEMQTDHNWMS